MYEQFRSSGEAVLARFFRAYDPPISARHHTCVGLGLELLARLARLETAFPGLTERLFLVSCEEAIESPARYMGEGAPPAQLAEKEHVLVALRVAVGGRPGVLLLDPGYHVARVVTVMADALYPNTGWFTQKDEGSCLKEYNYCLDSRGRYVAWHVQETSRPSGLVRQFLSLIFVARPFLGAVECTERRNLVYGFKSLLARDTKGHVLAGLYFNLDPGEHVTLFCQGDREQQLKRKLRFATFTRPEVPPETHELVADVAEQLAMSPHDLMALLCQLARIVEDKSFVQQALAINEQINEIAADN